MGRELFTNAVPSQLDGAINSSTTTVTVDDASTWPTGNFSVVCETEIMYCTSRSSNVLTVIRGTEGRSAAAHGDNVRITASMTAGSLQGFRRTYFAAMGMIPDEDSVSADDDDFDDENFSGWTAVNNGSNVPTIVERNHRCSAYLAGGGSGQLIQSYLKAKTPSAGDYIQFSFQNGRSKNYHAFGLIMSNGATYNSGRQMVFMMHPSERAFYLREWTGFNSWNTGVNLIGGAQNRYFCFFCHMRFVWHANNSYQCWQSPDGINWGPLNSVTTSTGTVGTVTHMGFCFTTWGASQDLTGSFPYVKFSF